MLPILLFPGQGSQVPGMSAGFMAHPLTQPLFQEADETLGFALSTLMREGPAEELTQTENAQPALLLAGIAALTYLLKQSGKTLPQLAAGVAGHSLGEYTAACAAGCLPLAEALKLVRLRGETMAKAVPTGQGNMSAVIGLPAERLEAIAAATGTTFANDNADGQGILSGLIPALMDAEDTARNEGARRVMRLGVSGPFHTPMMQPAAEAVAAALSSHPLKAPQVPVWGNATARPAISGEEVAANLVRQITSRVRWRETMMEMARQGVTTVLELGTGKVLAGLAPRCDARLQPTSLDTPEAIDTFLNHTSG